MKGLTVRELRILAQDLENRGMGELEVVVNGELPFVDLLPIVDENRKAVKVTINTK